MASFEQLLRYVLKTVNRRRWLLPLPMSVAELQARFFEKLPNPPLTRDQLKMLAKDNVVSGDALTLQSLGIRADALRGCRARLPPPVREAAAHRATACLSWSSDSRPTVSLLGEKSVFSAYERSAAKITVTRRDFILGQTLDGSVFQR